MFLFLLGEYQRVEFLSHVRVHFNIITNFQLFNVFELISPTGSTSLPTFVDVDLFNFHHFSSWVVIAPVIFIR